MVDFERVERRFAETVCELGLMDPDSNLDGNLDRNLVGTAGGDDGHRTALANYAIGLTDILGRLPEGWTPGSGRRARGNSRMSRFRPDWKLYRILYQPDLLDSEGRARPEAFEKIHLLVRGRPGL